jgi:mannose-6-phosphate isomerase-like protein (cupin superfamily)
MELFSIEELGQRQAESGKLYLEFLRVPSLSVGLYVLPAGGTDPQGPHTEDEVYYVAKGRGMITVGDEEQAVGPGSIVYVAANMPHRFHHIEEELRLVVFFAPPEYSLARVKSL